MEQLARPLDDMNRAGRTLTGHARSRQCRELVDLSRHFPELPSSYHSTVAHGRGFGFNTDLELSN